MDISNLDVEELWKRFSTDKTLELKNELVLRYVDLVKNIVLRLMPTYKGYSDFDDMLSCGIIGLMDAIDKYDTGLGVKFEYYAQKRIRGEIIDFIRKQDWAPSSLRRKIKEISNAYSDLEMKLLRSPTDSEVAQHLQMDEEDLHKTLGKSQMFNVIHFEEMVQDDASWHNTIQDQGDLIEDQFTKQESVAILGDFIEQLPDKERLVVTLYYYEELNLKEIAGVLGVSESRASQIHSKAVMKLRTKMQRAYQH